MLKAAMRLIMKAYIVIMWLNGGAIINLGRKRNLHDKKPFELSLR